MTNYLSTAAYSPSCSLHTLFVQPYLEGLDNCHRAFHDRQSPLSGRITRGCIGLGLIVPLLNSAVLTLLKCSSPSPSESLSEKIQMISPGMSELHFSSQDIEFLATQCLGLRHVSSRMIALKEALEGYEQGCSLSLAPHQAQLKKMGEKNWLEIEPIEQESFIQGFEEGIDNFIENSLIFDASTTEANAKAKVGETRMAVVANLVNYCSFSLVDYPSQFRWVTANFSADHSQWGQGLGRFRKSDVLGSNITLLPFVNLEDLGYSPSELQEVIKTTSEGDALFARMVACYRTTLIEKLRSSKQAL